MILYCKFIFAIWDQGIELDEGVAFIPCQIYINLNLYQILLREYMINDKKVAQNKNKKLSYPFQQVVTFIGI